MGDSTNDTLTGHYGCMSEFNYNKESSKRHPQQVAIGVGRWSRGLVISSGRLRQVRCEDLLLVSK
ncbi:hypothetical protein PISMIDRAFT_681705 [Pisolithus microcarpus 441]|uniref:Uncharacterized protein n=1 Tax=Pisolithus microcarpus 441 TaxID=765257 RepID=A0A0C9Z4P8_9AGAM|nr:hypothetical protein PISMIDRAFT_681705 [Pisolithus microcarpus 441]